jgi:3-deoxy-D-manno-octulosonic-acid transferase
MLYFFYDILLLLAFPFIALAVFSRSLRGKRRRKGVGERLGVIAPDKLAAVEPGGVWVHAVSVGETMAVRPLLQALKGAMPGRQILLSTVTETGQELAARFSEIDHRLYLPFDSSLVVRRVLSRIRPACIVIMETELWPNFIRVAREMRIPVILANGRISDRSFGRYLRLKWLFSRILADFFALCMQSEEDARRIAAMGASPDKVHAVGNLKYDIPARMIEQSMRNELRDKYGLPRDTVVVTAASTHQGEEDVVADISMGLNADGVHHLLVIAPRHPERADAVGELLRKKGITYCRRSARTGAEPVLGPGKVLLVDTIGELMGLYGASDAVFVGGSLVPTGGHNILEPLSCGVPTMFGPHMHNFREISALVLAAGAGIQVSGADDLGAKLRVLLVDPDLCRELGEKGLAFVRNAGGAVERHIRIIERAVGR